MNTEGLEARVKSLDDRLRAIEDVEEIENITVMYGSYLEYNRWEEVVELFSDSADTSIEIVDSGIFLGKAGVERVCKLMAVGRVPKNPQKEVPGMVISAIMFHGLMIGQPVVDVDPGGKVAYGRWRGVEHASREGAERFGGEGTWIQYWGRGQYENEYIKEDGRWKFKKLHWYLTFLTLWDKGWFKEPMIFTLANKPELKADTPSMFDHRYPDPEWWTVPFHYKHPITGK